MSPRTSLILHVVTTTAILFLVFATSSVGNVESFENWLLGRAELTTHILPHLAAAIIATAIMLHYIVTSADTPALKATVGGASVGFVVAILGSTFAGISPLLGLALTATGAIGGWAFAPRS